MKNDSFKRWHITDQQNNSSMKLAVFHKTLLIKTRHRQHPTPDISHLSPPRTSLRALQSRRTFKENSSSKAVVSPRELTPGKPQSSDCAKSSARRQIDWSVLREERHRPRFDRWQSKMVSQLVRRGKFQQLMSLLK